SARTSPRAKRVRQCFMAELRIGAKWTAIEHNDRSVASCYRTRSVAHTAEAAKNRRVICKDSRSSVLLPSQIAGPFAPFALEGLQGWLRPATITESNPPEPLRRVV